MSINSIPWVEATHKTPKLKKWYVKPIEMLCNNWAFILDEDDAEIIFVRDDGEVFDIMRFESKEVAVKGLIENGFIKFSSDKEARKYIVPPNKIIDFQSRNDIYSSGRYWIGKKQKKDQKSITTFQKIVRSILNKARIFLRPNND